MSYQANPSSKFIPSKSVVVYPDSRQNIRPNGDGVSQVSFRLAPPFSIYRHS